LIDDDQIIESASRSRSSSKRLTGKALTELQTKFKEAKGEEVQETTPTQQTTTCSLEQTLTQNLKAPSRNGQFNSYTGTTVTQATILQAHLNRLGFNSGPEDGILGPLSDGAIKRMQTFLKTTPDGFVGPITRGLLNKSCGNEGLQTN